MLVRKVIFCTLLMMICATCWCQRSSTKALSDTLQPAFNPDGSIDTSKTTIRSISIVGNRVTREAIVYREVAIRSGINYTNADLEKKMRLTKEQLMNTTLFVSVELRRVPAGDGFCDVQIVVSERWYLFPLPYFKVVDRNWNVWINDYKASLDRTLFGVKIAHNNTTGRNDKMNVWIIGGYTQQVEFKYQLPYVDKKMEKGFTVGMNYGRNREINYATDSNKQLFKSLPSFGRDYLRVEAAFSYRKGSQKRFYLRSIFGWEKIDTAFFNLNPNYLNGQLSASYLDIIANYQYFNVDYIPFPLRGWYIDMNASHRFSKALGMSQIGGRALATWEFLPKTYINFQTAFAYTLQRQQAYFNNRMMGYGSLYMQGLEYNVIDGTFGIMGRTTLRRKLFSTTFKGPEKWKTYSRIPFTFYLKGYGNLGYVYDKVPGVTNFMNNRLLRTAGFGLEIASIYDAVLKLEYSFNQFGQSGFFIHTSADF
ncbi:MAG: hypothetical protein IT252_05225 [Chitinophagaceae bacterium]|jgi:Surface antigen variable number repeat|nr:hypothetical protein [Chitinophagaceae bacterium]